MNGRPPEKFPASRRYKRARVAAADWESSREKRTSAGGWMAGVYLSSPRAFTAKRSLPDCLCLFLQSSLLEEYYVAVVFYGLYYASFSLSLPSLSVCLSLSFCFFCLPLCRQPLNICASLIFIKTPGRRDDDRFRSRCLMKYQPDPSLSIVM